ncbi:hypothetical protein A2U01_0020281, partial [Trifolium medium]|nr:hypothetical protein [Trifolium medium]
MWNQIMSALMVLRQMRSELTVPLTKLLARFRCYHHFERIVKK